MMLILPRHKLFAGLVTRIEAAEKALGEEMSARQTTDWGLSTTQESASALSQEPSCS
jgi:hypothetical protein